MKPKINNEFYDELGERWYADDQHPVALLRAEAKVKVDYILHCLRYEGIAADASILDIGCGAGFIANPLAENGYVVTGADISSSSLDTAGEHADPAWNLTYKVLDAYDLGGLDDRFDVVLLLDVLEHLEYPNLAIREAARVLKPGGLMFFHTFNRGWLSYVFAVKILELLPVDAPKNIHVYPLLIKPGELKSMCTESDLKVQEMVGIRPDFFSTALVKSLWSRKLHPDFKFKLIRSTRLGYLGYCRLVDNAEVRHDKLRSEKSGRPVPKSIGN
jgi:2-polyprenyl-6-hydroxyphenyl methylase / 3-demethylubiquinone-9 3-methyltransferase